MKIGILICNKLSYDCTGIGCFEALSSREHAFKDYKDVSLMGFFHCNGCKEELFSGMDYKFEQLKRREVSTIHMARCMEVECEHYDDIHNKLVDMGFKVVCGTHK